jgi:hypothetical protein
MEDDIATHDMFINFEMQSFSGVNLTNILRAAFAPIFLRQKTTTLKCKNKKAARKNLTCKMLVKLTTG